MRSPQRRLAADAKSLPLQPVYRSVARPVHARGGRHRRSRRDGIRRFVVVDLPERGDHIPANNVDSYVSRTLHYFFLRHADPQVGSRMGDAARDIIGNESQFDLLFRTRGVESLRGKSLKQQPIHTYCAGLLLLCAQQTGLPREEFFPIVEEPAGGYCVENLQSLGLSIGDRFVSPTGAIFAPHMAIAGRCQPMYDPTRDIKEAVYDHFAQRMRDRKLVPSPDLSQMLVEKLARLSKTTPWLARALALRTGSVNTLTWKPLRKRLRLSRHSMKSPTRVSMSFSRPGGRHLGRPAAGRTGRDDCRTASDTGQIPAAAPGAGRPLATAQSLAAGTAARTRAVLHGRRQRAAGRAVLPCAGQNDGPAHHAGPADASFAQPQEWDGRTSSCPRGGFQVFTGHLSFRAHSTRLSPWIVTIRRRNFASRVARCACRPDVSPRSWRSPYGASPWVAV